MFFGFSAKGSAIFGRPHGHEIRNSRTVATVSGPRLEDRVAVVYCGDPGNFRRKQCGLTLVDQLFASIESLRQIWSASIDVYFIHTQPLQATTRDHLHALNVTTVKANEPLCRDFPMANKILVGDYYRSHKDLLFLDCDTRFHRRLEIEPSHEIYAAYDVLQAVSKDIWQEFFHFLGVSLPHAQLLTTPAAAYYAVGDTRQFPQLNSGVFFLKRSRVLSFYAEWKRILLAARSRFGSTDWEFYIEQLSFIATIVSLRLDLGIFPPGINFICTPRASGLAYWPADRIIIEHYAGDTSRPLVFDQNQIDPFASGLSGMGASQHR
jgi:hypothetical protein